MKQQRHIITIVFLLCLITLIAYRDVAGNGFIAFDDIAYLLTNANVYKGFSWSGLAWAFTTPYEANWMPISWLSHMTDMTLFGANPIGHHLMSLLFHCVNTSLLFLVMTRLTGSARKSVLVAALFAVHPLNVETVAWIAERKNLISTSFFLLTILAYGRYINRPTIGSYFLVFTLYAFGLMSKPMLVTLPLLLILLDWYPLYRINKGIRFLVVEKLPFAAMALASSSITILIQYQDGAVKDRSIAAIMLNAGQVPVNYCKYILKTFVPTDLAVLYPYQENVPGWQTTGAVLLLLCITITAIYLRHSRPYLLTGWLWFLITLLPVAGFIRIGAHSIADRYAYLPLIGIFWAGVWLAADLLPSAPRWKASALAAVTILCTLCMFMTSRQVLRWRDSITLFRHTLAVTSGNWLIHNNTAVELIKQGDIAGSLNHVQQALRIKPDYADAYFNLGKIYANRKEYPQAIAAYRAAIKLDPLYLNAYKMLETIYTIQRDSENTQSIRILKERAIQHQATL